MISVDAQNADPESEETNQYSARKGSMVRCLGRPQQDSMTGSVETSIGRERMYELITELVNDFLPDFVFK